MHHVTPRSTLRSAATLVCIWSGAAVAAPAASVPPGFAIMNARMQAMRHILALQPRRPAALPTIVSGKIETPKINVTQNEDDPAISFKFQAPGYYNSDVFGLTGPSGQTVYPGYGIPPPGLETQGALTATSNRLFTIYSQPGTWTLTYGSITDLSGATTTYTQSQLAALFPSVTLTVVNPTNYADSAAPVVSTGTIVTTTVSLSSPTPFFEATLAATDNISGLGATEIYLNEPNGTAYTGSSIILPTYQTLAGNAVAGALLNSIQLPTGTWSITGYTICDIANNCLTQTDPATLQQQFSTLTFTVEP